jgi:filamentous hemagglutinin family protein
MKHYDSLNCIYRLVWNQTLNIWVAVAESAKGQGKSVSRSKIMVTATAAATAAALSLGLAPPALAAPTDGQVVAGAASVSQAGSTTTINQSSQNLAINWQDFSIAANEAVRFNQPNSSSIVLNRVIGQSNSQIFGAMSANGQVFILNPNGVLFGAGSQVNVGGLVASTLSLSNGDFMSGKYNFANNGGAGSITNQGTLTAAQSGYIALLAPEVINDGIISATLGKVVLAAGDQVTLNLNQDSLLGFNIDKGAFKALVDNKQLIEANGGQVFMSAKAADAITTAMVNNTGIIEARTMQVVNGTVQMVPGRIELMSDMEVGTVNVGGTLDASAPNGGDGGFIETSAAHVQIADDAKVTTLAAAGQNGSWLIDPPVDFTIAASGGNITGAVLANNLALGDVTIVSITSTVPGVGNINVNDPVTWSANKLTLNAQNNININADINASATASLALEYGQSATSGASNLGNIVTNFASVNLPAGTDNFTTKFGSNGAVETYTVITSLGVQGSTTGTDLQGIKDAVLHTNFALGSNIDAAATLGWNGGLGFDPITGFSGTTATDFTFFDGLGHTISNLTINRPLNNSVGLFGQTGAFSVLRNVGLIGGSVTGGGMWAGGLVGVNVASLISNVYNTGTVTGVSYVGGLVGDNDASNKGFASIINSYATGDVFGTTHFIGGLVGRNVQAAALISNSYATGNVSGTTLVGGLVGGLQAGRISNVYATGDVSGTGSVGGLTGDNYGPVDHAYSTGLVTGVSNLGGLVGFGGSSGVFSSYWNTTASTQAGSNGGTGSTTEQMQIQSSYAFWDFTDTWVINSAVNNGYPTFQGQARVVPPAAPVTPVTPVTTSKSYALIAAEAGRDAVVASFSRADTRVAMPTSIKSFKPTAARDSLAKQEPGQLTDQTQSSGDSTSESPNAAADKDTSSDEQFNTYRLINGGVKLPGKMLTSLNIADASAEDQ